ncbi:MAG: prepilin-type N-terminal cleavage/methylation domain-containing protein [Elusimicrobia bacterium]|nr:prepilin-type N-terminal cleavage/methylation domain-containing protein [Elusimicrobiota bacterium]
MFTRKEKGFTLIELMIVVAIIGILAAVAIPKFADLIDRAKEAKVKGNLSAIRSAVSIYYGSNEGLAPALDNEAQLATGLVTDGDNMSKLPGADIPTITGAGVTSGSWADDAATNGGVDYANKGGSDDLDGWSYDATELEVWAETSGADSQGNAIHEW